MVDARGTFIIILSVEDSSPLSGMHQCFTDHSANIMLAVRTTGHTDILHR